MYKIKYSAHFNILYGGNFIPFSFLLQSGLFTRSRSHSRLSGKGWKMRNVFHFNLRGNIKQVFETGGKSNGNLGSIIVVLCPSG